MTGRPETPNGTRAYRVRLWCSDCTGQDAYGCFDGGTELLHSRNAPWEPMTFPTLARAMDAGWDATEDCSPWGFDVFDENDEKVASSDG